MYCSRCCFRQAFRFICSDNVFEQKNRSLATETDEQASVDTSETASSTASMDIISHNAENDTTNFSDRDVTPYRILDEEYKFAEENKALKEDIKSLKYNLQIEREKDFRGSR